MTHSPSRVRYRMPLATTLVAVMLHLGRVCLSIVQAQFRPDRHLGQAGWDWLLSAFCLATPCSISRLGGRGAASARGPSVRKPPPLSKPPGTCVASSWLPAGGGGALSRPRGAL
jgi:hypothetical protein